jgi:hypothetical protein
VFTYAEAGRTFPRNSITQVSAAAGLEQPVHTHHGARCCYISGSGSNRRISSTSSTCAHSRQCCSATAHAELHHLCCLRVPWSCPLAAQTQCHPRQHLNPCLALENPPRAPPHHPLPVVVPQALDTNPCHAQTAPPAAQLPPLAPCLCLAQPQQHQQQPQMWQQTSLSPLRPAWSAGRGICASMFAMSS